MTKPVLLTIVAATLFTAACSKRVEPTPLAVAPEPAKPRAAEVTKPEFPALDDTWILVRARARGLVDSEAQRLLDSMWPAEAQEVAIAVRATGVTVVTASPRPPKVTQLSAADAIAGKTVRTMRPPEQIWPFEMVELPGNVIVAAAWRKDLENAVRAATDKRKLSLELLDDEAIALQMWGMRFGLSQRGDRIRLTVSSDSDKTDPGMLLGLGLPLAKRALPRGSQLTRLLEALDAAPRTKEANLTVVEARHGQTLEALVSDLVRTLYRQREVLATYSAIDWWLSLAKRKATKRLTSLADVFAQNGLTMPTGADRDGWGRPLTLRLDGRNEVVCSAGRNGKHGDYDDICGRNKGWSLF